MSIDVGIKNLAICMMTCKGKSFSINIWDNYNLLDAPVEYCSGLKKSGEGCNNKASCFNESGKFCRVHSKGLQNLKLIKQRLVDSYLLQDIALVVLKKAESIYSDNKDLIDSVDFILIENQPGINNKMKFVSSLLFGKFSELCNRNTKIRLISASSKLKIGGYLKYVKDPSVNLKGNKGYNNRKNLSIEYAKIFLNIESLNSNLEWFNKQTKKSDLADALCFCIYKIVTTDC